MKRAPLSEIVIAGRQSLSFEALWRRGSNSGPRQQESKGRDIPSSSCWLGRGVAPPYRREARGPLFAGSARPPIPAFPHRGEGEYLRFGGSRRHIVVRRETLCSSGP